MPSEVSAQIVNRNVMKLLPGDYRPHYTFEFL